MTGEKQFGAALYELALEEKIEDEVLNGINTVQSTFAENPQYLKLLSNPAVSKDERLALIEQAFSGGAHRYAVSFVKILCERGELSSLALCIKEFTALLNDARGILPVTAECAHELSAQQEQRLCEKLGQVTGKKIQLSCKIDPLLLGGVRLSYDGTQFDGTVRGRLNKLKASLLA